jgi:hypothetical protein
MNVFRDLERRIDQQLRKLFRSEHMPAQGRELVEIQRAILEEVSDRAHTLPRGRRVFPYNDVAIRIPVSDPERRAAFQVVFVDGDALENEIRQHLEREEIECPADLDVSIQLLEEAIPDIAAKGFHALYRTRERIVEPASQPVSRTVRITVLHGSASQPGYDFKKTRIYLGRMAEVLDDRRRPVRRNDVAFAEEEAGPNSTVSRAHAHIEFNEPAREYRLFDDGSAYGTSVLHDGQVINIPPGTGRGLRLHSGDEIYLGHARLRFEIE